LGFKVFKLAESHFETWAGEPAKYHEAMSLFRDPLKAGWTPEGVLWEVAVKEGYGLNCRIEPSRRLKPAATSTTSTSELANTVYRVTDPEKDPPQSFRACLDDAIQADIAKALELGTTDLFVVRDRALDDTLAANLALQCRLKTI
jgi:adenine-specific DNA-methyltransferase